MHSPLKSGQFISCFNDAVSETLNVIALENERTPPCRPRDKRLIPKFHPVVAVAALAIADSLSLSATVSSLVSKVQVPVMSEMKQKVLKN